MTSTDKWICEESQRKVSVHCGNRMEIMLLKLNYVLREEDKLKKETESVHKEVNNAQLKQRNTKKVGGNQTAINYHIILTLWCVHFENK